jgi:hypothetical protein
MRRHSSAHWYGNGQRELIFEAGQPLLLVGNQCCGGSAARKSHRQAIAEPKERIVPPRINLTQRQLRQIRMLLGKQRPDKRKVDRDIGSGGSNGRLG